MADWSRTIHGIGDLHAGAIKRPRVAAMLEDVVALPEPALHLQIGDVTERGLPEEDVLALRWLGKLPAAAYAAMGNHDINDNHRTAMAWAREYGYKSHNYVVDLDFLRIIVVSPDRDHPAERSGTLSARTLEWMEQRMRRSGGRDCWVACHWPLYKTVMGSSAKLYTSAMKKFHAKPDKQLRELLARNPNARAWLSGHTHSPLNAPSFVTRAKLPRGRSIVSVNLSALVGTGKTRDPSDPICSVYLTHHPGRIEIRFRDHRARKWLPVFRGKNVQNVRV